jgi:cytochrome c oxidase assembly protein subunit 15
LRPGPAPTRPAAERVRGLRTLGAVAVTSDERLTARDDAAPPSPVARWLTPVLVANLVAQIGIVVTGGLVRLTGSGLGCPSWPECVPGSYTPVVTQPQGIHKDIEFGNRLLTFVVSVFAIAAFVVVLRHVRAGFGGRRLFLLGLVPPVGVAVQAVVGGVTVRTDLNPNVVAPHFLISMVLIAASTALLLAARGDDAAPRAVRRPLRVLAGLLCVVAAVVVVLGTVVTGSGPHSGDAEEPARLGFDPRTVSWLHADAVWLFVGLVLALLLALSLTRHGTGDAPRVLRRAWALLAVTLLQGAIGYTQYALDLPIALVSLHMLGASLLVVAVTAATYPLLSGPRRGVAA